MGSGASRERGPQSHPLARRGRARGYPEAQLPWGYPGLIGECNFRLSYCFYWQERRDSNPQPPVLETGALPIELHSY